MRYYVKLPTFVSMYIYLCTVNDMKFISFMGIWVYYIILC